MFGFGTKKPAPAADRSKLVGLDLTASRARGVALAVGRTRPLLLDDPEEDLLLMIDLGKRTTTVGRSGYANCRRSPHLVCSNFLPQLGHARQWQAGRHSLSPEEALKRSFDELREPVTAETEAAGLVLPVYLTATQAKATTRIAKECRLPIRGTTTAPLALAAHRAVWVLDPTAAPPKDSRRPDWVVPIRQNSVGPAAIVVVDADEFALHATVVGIEPGEVKLLGHAVWPKLSFKLWKDRLLDAISDRCVRVCRRDPRDSADAEQALYERLDESLHRVRLGQPVSLTVRSEHWYQDLIHRPDEFDAFCSPLAKSAADGLGEMLRTADLGVPPRAVWLTDSAARLPGLAVAVHRSVPEQTQVLALSANAVADAVAALVPRWLRDELPRGHLDALIPLDEIPASKSNAVQPRPALPRG